MDHKVVKYHVGEFVNVKEREVLAEFRTLGPGQFPTGPAVEWLKSHGLTGANFHAYSRIKDEFAQDICATYPPNRRTVAAIYEWLEAPKVRVE